MKSYRTNSQTMTCAACLILIIMSGLPGCKKRSSGVTGASGDAGESVSALDGVLKKWRAAGGAVDLSEVSVSTSSGSQKNAADYHNFIMDRVNAISDDDRDRLSNALDLSPQQLESAIKFHKDLVPQIKEAARFPHCDWGTDYRDGLETLLPHLAYLRNCTRLMRADAILKCRTGDLKGAVESIECGLLLSRQCGQRGAMIGILVAVSIESSMLHTIDALFSDRTDVSLSSLKSLLDSQDVRRRFAQITMDEATILLGIERKNRFGHIEAPLDNIDDRFANEITGLLQEVLTYSGAVTHPYYDQPEVAEPILPTTWKQSENLAFDSMNRTLSWNASRREIAKLAIRLRDIKQQTGGYPSPSAVDSPIDPMDGKPIQYERTSAGGFRLTSSGAYGEPPEKIVWEWD